MKERLLIRQVATGREVDLTESEYKELRGYVTTLPRPVTYELESIALRGKQHVVTTNWLIPAAVIVERFFPEPTIKQPQMMLSFAALFTVPVVLCLLLW